MGGDAAPGLVGVPAAHPGPGSTSSVAKRLAVTRRDLELLRWTVRHGVVSAEQLGRRWFPSMWSAWRRLRRLEQAGLLRREPAFADLPYMVRVTPAGARLADCDLGPAPLDYGRLRHALAVVDLSERLLAAHPGASWITERELRRDRMRAARADPSVRQRRTPDGLLLHANGSPVAVELDLTAKRSQRLDQLAAAYALDPEIDAVLWFLPSRTAVHRMHALVIDRGLDSLIKPRLWQVAAT